MLTSLSDIQPAHPLTTSSVSSTEWRSPTATGRRYNEWDTPENAYSSDDQYAVANTWYDSQDWYNFGFNIPSGSTIDGIEIKLEGTGDGIDYVGKVKCRVFYWDIAFDETDYLEFPATEDAFHIVGGPSDLWGCSIWTPENFEDNAEFPFVVRLTTGADWHTCRLDNIQVKVYYTEGLPNQPPSVPTAVSQYRSDGVTVISEGGTTPESTVVFKATVSDPDGDSVRLEIELRQMGEAFTGEPTP